MNPSVDQTVKQEGWHRKKTHGHALRYHDHLVRIFRDKIEESEEDERQKVLALIQAGSWDRDPKHFYESLQGSRHEKMLTPYSVEDLKGMDTFKVPGYRIGFALKDHDGSSGWQGRVDIVAVHNNSSVHGIGRPLIVAAFKAGGKTLDHFDGYLSKLYAAMGLEEYRRDPYDAKYDEGGEFAKKYGEQPVIYRRLPHPVKKEPDVHV